MPCLIQDTPEGPRVFELKETTYIGRAPECDIVLSDASISRRHARIHRVGGKHVLQDEGSRFGSFVNGSKVASFALSEGDRVQLGSVELIYRLDLKLDTGLREITGEGERLPVDPVEVKRILGELERTKALLALQHTFVRCTSLNMVLQGAGPELTRKLRADRALVLIYDSRTNAFTIQFQQGLPSIPQHRVGEVDQAFSTAQIRHMTPDHDGRIAMAIPIPGSERYPQGLVYVEFPPGRVPEEGQIEMARAMCGELGSALTHHRLLNQVREEAEARSNLSRYLADQVVEAVLAGKINLAMGGEHRTVTVLFTDIRSFTTLSERMPPEHVLSMLNEYFSEAVPIIKRYEGTVDKFIGDALMAVFGAPNELPDQALRAVRAAVEIRDVVRELRVRWADRPWAAHMDVSNFAVGIGVNTGPAVAGNLGSEDRREYGVIGDAVNVAARLCSKAGPDEVFIGGDTAAGVGDQMQLKFLEPMPVKGRQQPVQAYSVL
ncbi:MAG: adenylate/guanylate cyclase domain-containing protein [Deltaproteobacteria bacterium]|nr:adenylate/guanylate cyclase domain-containing protein [Deltaproteobacteria bacterium]